MTTPPLETIWTHGHERSWQRVSIRRYPHFVHIVCEQLVVGEILSSTAIVPARALGALVTALTREEGAGVTRRRIATRP